MTDLETAAKYGLLLLKQNNTLEQKLRLKRKCLFQEKYEKVIKLENKPFRPYKEMYSGDFVDSINVRHSNIQQSLLKRIKQLLQQNQDLKKVKEIEVREPKPKKSRIQKTVKQDKTIKNLELQIQSLRDQRNHYRSLCVNTRIKNETLQKELKELENFKSNALEKINNLQQEQREIGEIEMEMNDEENVNFQSLLKIVDSKTKDLETELEHLSLEFNDYKTQKEIEIRKLSMDDSKCRVLENHINQLNNALCVENQNKVSYSLPSGTVEYNRLKELNESILKKLNMEIKLRINESAKLREANKQNTQLRNELLSYQVLEEKEEEKEKEEKENQSECKQQ